MKLRFTFFKELSSSLKKAALEALRFRREPNPIRVTNGFGMGCEEKFNHPKPATKIFYFPFFNENFLFRFFRTYTVGNAPPRLFFLAFLGGRGVFPNYSSFQTRKSQK